MHGFINDAEGRKMSKSLGNYILPKEVIDKYGADTLRYYMIGGALPAVDINYNFDDIKTKSRNLAILWNLHKFLIDYSKEIGKNIKDIDENLMKDSFGVEERYILSKLNSTVKDITEIFDDYKLNTQLVEHNDYHISRIIIPDYMGKAAKLLYSKMESKNEN